MARRHVAGGSPTVRYRSLEVLGPEHEYAVVDEALQPLAIVDAVIKGLHGRIVNFVDLGAFTFGKELQAHVAEIKANTPFRSPRRFNAAMHQAVTTIVDHLDARYGARLLGTGMHPLLRPDAAKVWAHRDRTLYRELHRLFNLTQHGWLNIQAFQLNLPYAGEGDAVRLHNALANLLPYLPAIAASSPVYEGTMSAYTDSRLHFYRRNQRAIPSITGDVIPAYVASLREYRRVTIDRYTADLKRHHAPAWLHRREWLNSRGAIFRFDRRALEVRIMDEQECVRADVALSCFIRAWLRGRLACETDDLLRHEVLVGDLHAVIRRGLHAAVRHPRGRTAREVCRHLYRRAVDAATTEEKRFLPLVHRRIEEGNLADRIRARITTRAQRTDLREAIVHVYAALATCLERNTPFH
jgi:gamma-glutamyl:cysteine ligase YbdK (ATP-grasp superfamily)